MVDFLYSGYFADQSLTGETAIPRRIAIPEFVPVELISMDPIARYTAKAGRTLHEEGSYRAVVGSLSFDRPTRTSPTTSSLVQFYAGGHTAGKCDISRRP